MSSKQEHTALSEQLHYVALHSPFYRRLFSQHGVKAEEIRCIDDLRALPFTEKEDLQKYSADFICVSRNRLIDYVATSGTTGKPVTLALTSADLDRLARNEYNSFKTAGITDQDIIQLMTTIDRRFMAGMAYFLGARQLGAGIIRVGNGLPELQWDTIQSLQPSVIICVPSFLLRLIEYAETHGIAFRTSSVKKAICIGEPVRNADFTLNTLGEKISQKWNIRLYSTYASSEMATAFTECDAFRGGHLQEDLLVTELIDEHGEPVRPGEPGELVITTLGVEGMPLVRYKTGDICIAHTEPCTCGNHSLRLGPVIGRKKQMIKYKGTSLYPPAIYEVLENHSAVSNYQVEVSDSDSGTDDICISIGILPGAPFREEELMDTFRAKLRVVPRFRLLPPEQISAQLYAGGSRKPIKFIDRRNKIA